MKTSKFREILLIQKSEIKAVNYLFIFSLFLGIPQIATMTVSSTLLLRDFSPEYIPRLFLYNGIGISVISAVLLLLIKNRTPKAGLSIITGFLLMGTTILIILLNSFPGKDLLSAVLFFWSRVENTLMAVGFVIAGNALFTPRASRRLIGLTSTGQVITLVAGGLLIPLFLNIFPPLHLLWFSLTGHLAMFVHSLRFMEIHKQIPPQKAEENKKSLVVWIFLTIGFMYLLYYTIDSVFLGAIHKVITDTDQIARFVARFWVTVGLIALMVKLFITGRFLQKFGLISGLILPPAVLMALSSVYFLILSPGDHTLFKLIIMLKACERILDGSLFLPAFYGLFQGLEPVKRQKTQLLSDSLIGQISAGLAGVIFLILKQNNQFELKTGLMLSVCFALILIMISIVCQRKYHRKMEQYLNPPMIQAWRDEKEETPVLIQNTDLVNWQKRFLDQVLQICSLRSERPDSENFEPLSDAWLYEWDQKEEKLIRLLFLLTKSGDLIDRWKRLKNMPSRDQMLALEGLSQRIPSPWKNTILSILAKEEAYLILKTVTRLKESSIPEFHFSENNEDLSSWSRKIVKISKGGNREKEWAVYEPLTQMRKSEFFESFPYEFLQELLSSIVTLSFSPGESIINEGESGESMYIQAGGICRVFVKGIEIASLEPGSCFGELSSILPEKRSATIIADTTVHIIEISRTPFLRFLITQPEALKKIQLVLYKRLEKMITPGNKGPEVKQKISSYDPDKTFLILKKHPVLQKLKSPVLQNLAANTVRIKIHAREEYIPDEENSTGLHILISGRLAEYWGGRLLSEKKAGGFPAIHVLVDQSDYRSRLVAIEDSLIIRISRPAYLLLLSEDPIFQMELTKELIKINRKLLLLTN